jgi:hypothetical protein
MVLPPGMTFFDMHALDVNQVDRRAGHGGQSYAAQSVGVEMVNATDGSKTAGMPAAKL